MHGRVTLPGARGKAALGQLERLWIRLWWWRIRGRQRRVGSIRRRVAQALPVRGHALVHGLTQVVPQVPSVGDLDRVGCAVPAAQGVGTGPIPADHFGAGMRLEPRGERAGLAVGEQVDRMPVGHVDQDRAVVMPPPEREIVHAEHRHRRDRRVGQAADQPQQAAARDAHAQGGRQPRPRPAGQRQRDRDHHAPQQRGPPGVAGSQVGNLLGEGDRRAVRVVTEEPTRREPDRRRPAADHRIGQGAHIPTVHASRFPATASAPRPRRTRVSAYLHPVHVGRDTVDDQQRQMGQQNSQPPVHSGTALLVWLGFLAEPGISQEGLSRLPDTPRIDVTNWLLQEF